MALIQKNENKTIVPWFNRNEWFYVFKLLYSFDSNFERQIEALNILKIWKTRTPLLPAGLEGTYIILQVIIEHPAGAQKFSHYDIQILYSTAIMRFLNVCVTHDSKQGTFYQMAKKMKIPNWIISLRHDIAHSSNIPSLELLQKVSNFAYKWLYNEYWYPVSLSILDYKRNLNEDDFKLIREKLQFLISVFECMIICKLSKCNIKKIADIPDLEAKEQILNDLSECDKLPKITEETTVEEVMCLLNTYICKYINEVNIEKPKKGQLIVDILLNGDTFLCAPELKEIIIGSESIKILPWNFVKLWQQVFMKLEILDPLLISLIKITTSENETHLRKTMACLWIIEITKGLHKMDSFSFAFQNTDKKDNEFNERIIPKMSNNDYKRNPEFESVLTLNVHHDLPSLIKNLDIFQQEVLLKPTKYTKIYLSHFLNAIKPPLSNSSKTAIQDLINVYIESSNLNNEVPEKVYNVNDLDEFSDEYFLKVKNKDICSETILKDKFKSEEKCIRDNLINKPINQIWERAPDNVDFSSTPLGLLPWQQSDQNPTLKMQQTFL